MKRLIPLLVLAAALAVPAIAGAATSVVLKVDRGSKLVAVAQSRGHVALVHTSAASRLQLGQKVELTSRTLRNGTLASKSIRVVGRAGKTHIRAMVLAHRKGRVLVSAGGAVLSIRIKHGRSLASANDTTHPPVGSTVDVTVQVHDNELDEDSMTVVDPNAPGGKIEGTLTIGTGTITVADDGMALRFAVPSGFDLTAFKTGQKVLATFTQNADGTLSLTRLSGNDDEQEADDQGQDEHDGDNDDNGGGGGGHDD